MISPKILRPALFAFVAFIHLILLFFLAFNVNTISMREEEPAHVMKLTDIEEEVPPPPPPPLEEVTQIPVETIAENIIETDDVSSQILVAPGTIVTTVPIRPVEEVYLQMHQVSEPPKIDERQILSKLVYPSIALRSGIEGSVIVELFIDKAGTIRNITIMKEAPEGRGFGEAAVKAFEGVKAIPARANGEPVSVRYRYPVRFKLR
jgi:protein TonB